MKAQDIPTLHAIFSGQSIDVVSAFKCNPEDTYEALFRTLLSLPLSLRTVTRIKLGIYFRGSLQSPRSITPYRLHTIIAECKAGSIKRSTLEAKFFDHGGTKAVTSLAAAITDNKEVIGLLENLEDNQLQRFVESIQTIEPHQDLRYIVDTLERKKPPRVSKRKLLPSKLRRCKKKQSRQSREGETSSQSPPRGCIGSEPQLLDTDGHVWQEHLDISAGYEFISESTHGPVPVFSKSLHGEGTSIETHISEASLSAFVADTHNTTPDIPLMKRQQQPLIDTRLAFPSTTQSEQSETLNTSYLHGCSQHAEVLPQQTQATYMSLEDISATATYMDPNSFEHYGVDLDMFNVL